jgi:hypothetical protein
MARKRRKTDTERLAQEATSGAQGAAAVADARVELAVESLALLFRGGELLRERPAWTRGQFARDRHSKPVSPSSDRAVRFCAGGALMRATTEKFDVTFVLSSATSPPTPLPPALAQAYRLLGKAFVLLFISSEKFALREDEIDGVLSPVIVERDGGEEAVSTWPSFVAGCNDNPLLKHEHVRAAFTVALMLARSVKRIAGGEGGDA